MMNLKAISRLIWCMVGGLLQAVSLQSQDKLGSKYPQDFFGSPLDIPLNLSGNFGELRTNHFHAGLDIKTNQQEGLNLYAVADGFVSRIKVSPFGYGYALYITHPNGYTTVYGHMKKYGEKIDSYVKAKQYELQSFSVDLFPDSSLLPVMKGEIIGLSGNSGGSGGPHLHFEIRETVSEKVMNPLLFGFKIKDKVLPSVSGIWILPLGDDAAINGKHVPLNLTTKAGTGKCTLSSASVPIVHGDIGFAVHTTDGYDGNSNRCGIYRVELRVDSQLVFAQRMDRLDFTTNRAMNAHTIYEKFKQHRSSIHSSYRLPGNPLDIYEALIHDGVLTFNDENLHFCEYTVYDYEGNKSTLPFKVKGSPQSSPPKVTTAPLAVWNWEKDNAYSNENVRLSMPAFTLYDHLDLTIETNQKIANTCGPTYLIGSNYTPVHNGYSLCLNSNKVPATHLSKAVIVRFDPDKGKIHAELTKVEQGWLCASPMYLGYYSIQIDTIAPSISSIDFAPNMKGRGQFSMRISDGLSGLDQIIPKIDGQWVLMEFDAKNSRLTYYFDTTRLTRGTHQFALTVIDAVGNKKEFAAGFEW
jgi:murein DD-endopeptidase MepM/ murein hydrolase activator NlpD